jgi:ribonuclease P protein component
LRARTQFLEVQNTGRRVVARYLTMLGRPNGGAEDRLGIIASRRLGGAVDRNRAKRRIREVFRRQRSTGGPASGQPPLDLVVIARPGIVDAPFGDVTADFQTALRKLRGSR